MADEHLNHPESPPPESTQQMADLIARNRAEADAENERILSLHGSLDCPACGGSGHVGDTWGPAPQLARETRSEMMSRLVAESDAGVDCTVTLVEALDFRREQYGLTWAAFGMLLGLHPSHMSEIKHGKRSMTLDATRRAYAIGVPAAALLQHPQRVRPAADALPASGQRPVPRAIPVESCRSCPHCVGRIECAMAGRTFDDGRPDAPPDWCPLPALAEPRVAQD